MNIDESTDDKLFREEARNWLMANVPRDKRPREDRSALEFDRHWQHVQFDGGWAGVNWPQKYGGRGLSGYRHMIWLQECARAGAPAPGANYTGLHHAGPTLIVCGSEDQKKEYLPAILKGEKMWCQGFSEPNAGSDLASMRTKGVIEGSEIVVNGHKTWTSNGQYADYQELVVRTDPESKRHRGLTWIICDMKAEGIESRPITTMYGKASVNDTFYDDVRLPLENVVGEIGKGWSVAMSTLSFERGTGFIDQQVKISETVERLIEIAKERRLPGGQLAIENAAIAEKLAFIKAQTLAIKSFTLSILSEIERSGQPGAEGSMMKVYVTTVHKHLFELASEVIGPEFIEYGDDPATNEWAFEFLYSWVYTIAGGSNEIQRDIIADRVLELPRAR